jgi:hypothetical protein
MAFDRFDRSEEEFIRRTRAGSGVASAEFQALLARVRALESDLRDTRAAAAAAQETASLQNLLRNSDFG